MGSRLIEIVVDRRAGGASGAVPGGPEGLLSGSAPVPRHDSQRNWRPDGLAWH